MKQKKKSHRILLSSHICITLAAFTLSSGISDIQASEDKEFYANETQQNFLTITGQVIDNNKEPLIGVSVVVKGSNTGTVTDIDGNFTLKVPTGSSLVFSYIGYISQTVAVKGNNPIQIILIEDSKMLDDVVVVGYGTMKKTDVATAISSIKPEDFNVAGAASRDVRQLLDGKVAGLTITRTGGSDPNAGSSIQMRGVTSVKGDQKPLVVIDGIPGGNLDLLRPEDIASIDVLKDGSAAAIYGSRGNAGVILITTKRGTSGATKVEYSGYTTKFTLANPDDVRFMNPKEYRQAMLDLGNPSYMIDRGYNSNMYTKLMNKGNLSHSHNLSISGGSETTVYRASLYYSSLESIARKRDREQYGGRLSLESKGFNNMLTFQTNLALNHGDMGMLGNSEWEEALRTNPTNPIYNEDGTFFEDKAKDENKYARLLQQKYKRLQSTSSLDAKITLEPIKDFRISAFGSITKDDQKENKYYLKSSRSSIDDSYEGGYAFKSSKMNTLSTFETTSDYSIVVNDKHRLNAIAGYSYQYQVEESFDVANRGFLNDSFEENNLEAGSWLHGSIPGKYAEMHSDKRDETLIAFLARVNYAFDGKYVFQYSIRHEGSSKFGANNKWGTFQSFSGAWNVTNEEFMADINVLSNLKIRIGYGETGNSGIDPYQSVPTLGTGNNYLYPDGSWQQTYGPNKNPNPNLKWETKKEWNFGIDFGILKNRLTGAIDFYHRKADDLLMENVKVPTPSNIHSSSTMNVGAISSKGLEVTLNAIPLTSKNFEWKTDFILSKTFSNKLDKFAFKSDGGYITWGSIGGSGALGDAVRMYEGSNIGDFYGKRFAGFDEKGEWLFYKKDGSKAYATDIKEEDKTVIGNGQPKWYLSLSNNFRYKNFDASFLFRGRFGFDILNRLKMTYGNLKTLQNGDNILANSIKGNLNTVTYQYSDYFLENGNYLKLDNITIGYTFKKNSPLIPTFRVYMTATDLFTITKYKGYSPELDDTGLAPSMEDRGRSPITRSFTLGVNLQF